MSQAFTNLSDPRIANRRGLNKERTSDTLVGLGLVVVLPSAFWMGLIELAAIAFKFSYGSTERIIVGCAIGGFLALIYGCIRLARN